MTQTASPAEIVEFWTANGPKGWFLADPLFDAEIAIRFGADVRAARAILAKGPHPWESAPESALALMLLTDQFPRNIYRGLGEAWSGDPLALAAARRTIEAGMDGKVDPALRVFFYLPFEHSEALEDQERAVALIREAFGEDSDWLLHARAHRNMVAKFGRFPARNVILGRATTDAERAWLSEGGYGAELRAVS